MKMFSRRFFISISSCSCFTYYSLLFLVLDSSFWKWESFSFKLPVDEGIRWDERKIENIEESLRWKKSFSLVVHKTELKDNNFFFYCVFLAFFFIEKCCLQYLWSILLQITNVKVCNLIFENVPNILTASIFN